MIKRAEEMKSAVKVNMRDGDGQVVVTGEVIITILVSVAIMVGLTMFTTRTRTGKAMRAVSEDQGAAQLMGVNVNKTISITFAIGSALAAIAGIVYVAATYGDRIVAWAKKILASCPCCDNTCECVCEGEGECQCGGECKCEGEIKQVITKIAELKDYFVDKSVWIIGGDGWAYDIGYGGLDHVLASGKNVKVLVLDTEVYSNTGGQASKSTPIGAIAKFAASGKVQAKKNLGLMQMQYKNVYVAYVSMGANPAATVKAFNEAENYDGPALIVAYAHCIEQGLLTKTGPAHQQAAVDSVHFPLWRYNPSLAEKKLQLDSADKSDTVSFAERALSKDCGENRFKQLVKKVGQENAEAMLKKAEEGFKENYARRKEARRDVRRAKRSEEKRNADHSCGLRTFGYFPMPDGHAG